MSIARYAQITVLGFSDNLPYEKVGKNEPVCIADEVPFDIPESWEWVRVKHFTTLYNGRAFKPSDWTDTGLPIVRIQNLNNQNSPYNLYNGFVEPEYQLYGGELLFAWSGTPGTSFGAHIWCGKEAVLNQHIFRLDFSEKVIYKPYYMYALNQRIGELIKAAHGSAGLQHVTKGVFENTLIPIPPYKEQIRIVNKLNQLAPAFSSYSKISNSIKKLNNEFPEKLKKSILQDAVQGKLVPQDPADEPASVLLERIRAEKEQLIKAGKIKRDKHESVIFRRDNSYYEKVDEIERCIDDEIPFEIPESWEWCRLKSLTENITSGSRDWAKYYSTTGAAFLRMGNLSKNSFDLRLEHIQRVTIPSKAEGTRTSLQSGDLLFSITGDVGMLGLIPDGFEKAYINQHTAMIRFLPEMRNKYIPYLLLTDYAQKFYNANQHGIKNSFRLDSIGELLVSIPPEKELFRILQRISLVLSKIAVL